MTDVEVGLIKADVNEDQALSKSEVLLNAMQGFVASDLDGDGLIEAPEVGEEIATDPEFTDNDADKGGPHGRGGGRREAGGLQDDRHQRRRPPHPRRTQRRLSAAEGISTGGGNGDGGGPCVSDPSGVLGGSFCRG